MKTHIKKIGIAFAAALLIAACGKGNFNQQTTPSAALTTNAAKKDVSNTSTSGNITATEIINAELTSPPFVPKAIGDRKAAKLRVDVEIIEAEGEMADGVKYLYWTFNGTVPG